ncbi:glycosyltransferase family 2 protein [Blastococcus sp. SYSU DS0617]
MTDPLVSILIPTYNGEAHLRAALRSARDQSYRHVEIVIGDDASTDRTPEIIAAAAAEDERIRVIRHETNGGGYDNLQSILRAARGEYVKYLLHDDVLATDCVRELVRGLQSTPGAALAFSRRSLIDENGKPVAGHEFSTLRDRPGAIDGLELGTSVLETCTNVIGELSTALFRRDALGVETLWEPDGRRIDSLTDVKVWLELLAQGPAFYTPRVLSRFRIHPGQNSWRPWIGARAERDWVRLIDYGIRLGFLPEPAQRRRAHARVLQHATARLASIVDGPDYGPVLESIFLSTAALVELRPGAVDDVVDSAEPLWERAHRPDQLAHLAQQLEVWSRLFPIALAAPALERNEVSATVQALRDVHAAGVAEKLAIAVPSAALEAAVPLIEQALAEGADIDVELVPCDDPAGLLAHPWLAVAPRGSRWHLDRGAGVWTFDVAADAS